MKILLCVIAGIITLAVCVWSWRLSNVDNTEPVNINSNEQEKGGNEL